MSALAMKGFADLIDREAMQLQWLVEHFLTEEAALLDHWKLTEWLDLFTDDGRYEIPTTDRPDGDPRRDLMFVDDNMARLRGRVDRLNSGFAHCENPFSRTRRSLSNIRIIEVDEGVLRVESSFIVYRARAEHVAAYVGLYRHTVVRQGNDLKIRFRRAETIHERLSEHDAASIIL